MASSPSHDSDGPRRRSAGCGLVTVLAATFCGVLLGLAIHLYWASVVSAEREKLQDQLRSAKHQYELHRPIIMEVDDFKRKKQDLEIRVAAIENYRKQQKAFPAILHEILEMNPDDLLIGHLQIDHLNFQQDTVRLHVTGDCQDVTLLLNRFEDNPRFLSTSATQDNAETSCQLDLKTVYTASLNADSATVEGPTE